MRYSTAAFTYPITVEQIQGHIPRATPSEAENARAAIDNEAEIEADNKRCNYQVAAVSAATSFVNWYMNAEDDYRIIRGVGLAVWAASRRRAYVYAHLLRAKHDGVQFDL